MDLGTEMLKQLLEDVKDMSIEEYNILYENTRKEYKDVVLNFTKEDII